MTERERLIELIKEMPWRIEQEGLVGPRISNADKCADYLLANGGMLVDTEAVDLVTNREPIRTAFGMPLDELAELIRAKQEGRIIVPPCKVGDKIYSLSASKTKLYLLTITHFVVCENETQIWAVGAPYTSESTYICNADDLGNNEWVYLTPEEAEKALERGRG